MNDKLSTGQLWILVSSAIMATVLIYIPTYTIAPAGKDAWLAILINMFVAIPAIMLMILPGLRFPGLSFTRYSEAILGNIPGKAVSLVFAFIFLLQMAITLRQFSSLIIISLLPRTPISVLLGGILLMSTFGVYKGIQTLGRFTKMMATFGFGTVFLVLVVVLPRADFSNIYPILEYGWGPVLSGIFGQLAFMPQVIIMAFLMDKLTNPLGAIKAAIGFVVLLGGTLIVLMLVVVAVYTEEYARLLFIPFLSMARLVVVPGSLFTMDTILMALWIIGIFIKVTVLHYIAASTLGDITRMKDWRSLTMPVGLIAAFWSVMIFANHVELQYFILNTLPIAYLTLFIGIPALMLLIAVIRKMGEPSIVTLRKAFAEIKSDIGVLFSKLKRIYDDIYMPAE